MISAFKKKFPKIILATFLLLLAGTTVGAEEFMFRHLEVKDGLSSNQVLDIHRDSEGFVWFATVSGLNRYDGTLIRIFFGSENDTKALRDSYVKSIQEDGEGRLWLETGKGYCIYNPETEKFDRDMTRWLAYVGLYREPDRVYIDRDKNIWIYASGQGCFRMDVTTRTIDKTYIWNGQMPEGNVTGMAQCSDGILLVYNDGMLVCLNPDNGHLKWVNRHLSRMLGTGVYDVFSLFVDKDDDIWVYSPFGVWAFNSGKNQWMTYSGGLSGIHDGNNMVHAVAQDSQGRIWLGTDRDGIEILDKFTGKITHVSNIPTDDRSLQNNNVMALRYDCNEIMWIGTFKKGISYYNESAFKFGVQHVGDVNCIEEDKPGHVWFGTNDAGLVYWDLQADRAVSRITRKDGLGSDAVVCMLKTRDRRLWVGTFWGGLDCIDNGHLTHYRHDEGRFNTLVNNNVWSLVEDVDGYIWVGTLGGGVQRLDPRTGQFTTYNINLPSYRVSTMCITRDNVLWIGTDNGICTYNIRTGETGNINSDGLLSNRNINHLYADSRGLVWIGTREGLNIYNPRTGEIKVLNEDVELPSPVVTGITEDDNKTVWATTARGVVNIIPTMDVVTGEFTCLCHVYNDMDGLQSSEFNQRSIKKLYSGEILMGGMYGVNSFRPDEIHYNRILPNVIFTGFSLFSEEVAIGQEYKGRVILERALNYTKEITLKYEQNVFGIRFSNDNLILPGKAAYLYKLDGFNEDWTSTTEGNVTYTNLSPGKYTFRVKAVNSDGYPGVKEATLRIIIKPPFGLSWVAIIIYVVALLAAMLIVGYIISRVERGKFRLQQVSQAAARNQEVNDMKLRFFTNISHELRTPLTLIISPLESLVKDYAADDVLSDKLKMIQRNVVRLSTMVTQILDFRKSDVSGHHLNLSDGEIVSYIEDICNSFVSLADRRDVQLTFYSSVPSLTMSFDVDKVGKIVNNLLSNAFKFTPKGGRVDVALNVLKAKDAAEVLEIKVADTGIGIKDQDKKHIFERFYQAENPGLNVSGSGIGLNLAYDFVILHGGTITVSDNVPRGTVFIVSIPSRRGEKEEIPQEKSADGQPVVLVVDDNDEFLTFMFDSLRGEYNVKLATSGKEALEMIRGTVPDIIISDVMMPGIDGNEFCRQVKADSRTANVPFVLLTARHSYESRLEGLTAGADDYMTKPFTMDVLKLRISKLLDIRQRRSHIEPKPSDVEITSMDEKLIERGVKYVEDNISRSDLSVEELSAELGMSRVNLYKKLLALTDRTPIEFIRIIRLRRAEQLLRESQMNVSEVAYQVGYNGTKYFSKYFKEEFGMTPSEYLEKHRGKS